MSSLSIWLFWETSSCCSLHSQRVYWASHGAGFAVTFSLPPVPPWRWSGAASLGRGVRTCCACCRTPGTGGVSLAQVGREGTVPGLGSSRDARAAAPAAPWATAVGEDWALSGRRPEAKSRYIFTYIMLYNTVLKMAKPGSCLCEEVSSVTLIQLL